MLGKKKTRILKNKCKGHSISLTERPFALFWGQRLYWHRWPKSMALELASIQWRVLPIPSLSGFLPKAQSKGTEEANGEGNWKVSLGYRTTVI